MDFIALDFETANRQTHSACSVALTIVRNSQIEDEYYTLIQPETWFDRMNTQIHGISESDVVNAPKFPAVWNDVQHFFSPEQLVIAHNMPFDKRILKGTLDYYGLDFPPFKTLCTVQSSRAFLKTLPNHKLNTIASYYGIPLNHHHAQDDARACATILLNQEKEYGISSLARFIKQ